ncbi:MAG: cache domain-containing protein [Candidatus Kapabacteria bacterium]|nr:cache domain-containing protein [Ignavibacteriota bacterium]MCW5884729.1 cache domain-containing protein [Candidatus Kapabacteria bacterium]
MKLIKNIDKKKFLLTVVLPAFIAQALFIGLIFAVIIPYFNHNLIEAKKEMILELINSSICIAEKHFHDAEVGLITHQEAQEIAIQSIASIRYGTANKDYIWITDTVPNMIMHPYRKDLIGKNIENFTDLNGKKMFAEMVEKVNINGEGYVDYMWQWMDDSTKIVPKISYIKEFKEWNWILGTGVYIEDVRSSISRVVKSMIWISLGIFILISFLLVVIARRNLKVERERNKAEQRLKESNEKYKSLVEASTDGTLLFLNGECVYKNITICKLINCADKFTLKPNLEGIISSNSVNDLQTINEFLNSDHDSFKIETKIVALENHQINVLISFSKVFLSGSRGLIIVIKDLSRDTNEPEFEQSMKIISNNVSEGLKYGIFKASADRKARLIEANTSFAGILGYNSIDEIKNIDLFNLFENVKERREFISLLFENRYIPEFRASIINKDKTVRYLFISAVLNKQNDDNTVYIEGFVKENAPSANISIHNQKLLSYLISQTALMNLSAKDVRLDSIPVCSDELIIKDALELLEFQNSDVLMHKSNLNKTFGFVSKDTIFNQLSSGKFSINERCIFESFTIENVFKSDITVIKCVLELIGNQKSFVLINDNGSIKQLKISSLRYLLENFSGLITKKPEISESLFELKQILSDLPNNIENYIKSGTNLKIITKTITNLSEEITKKLISNSIKQLGNPPAEFAFLALGSEGRSEQGLSTDQDNAIIIKDLTDNIDEVRSYFLNLAEIVNKQLDYVGYKLCTGDIMAKNPRWNEPLQVWKQYFHGWITLPEPQNLIDSSIFFDFRSIYGSSELSEELRKYINSTIRSNPAFLSQMALMSINYKLPVGIFGKIQTESKENQSDKFNLKNALRLLVNIVRLYAMKFNINETNTLLRLEALHNNNHISTAFYEDVKLSFEYLMNLQFKNQTRNISHGLPAGNYLNISTLSETEISFLKLILGNISTFQSKIKFDFGIN